MSSVLSVTINDRPISVRATATVLQACDSAGVDVPRFCYHERLSVAGNCRICLVEIQKSPKPVVACAIPVSPNRVIYTNTPLVRKAREAVLEFLLLNHPLDCPICDQGGECDLQEEAIAYGADRGRNFDGKRSVEDKECGPIVKTIRTRCIHCTRCVRFSAEVAGIEARGAFGRGEETEIGTYVSSFLRTELSGNLVDLCPVGALTSKPYAYTARRWELASIDGIDFFDAFGADIIVQSRAATRPIQSKDEIHSKERVLRVLPRTNSYYPEIWLSDRSRYGIEGLYYNRLLRPHISDTSSKSIKNSGLSASRWIEALTNLAPRLLRFNSASVFIGNHINLEEIYSTISFASRRGWAAPQIGSSFSVLPTKLSVDSLWSWNLNQDRAGHSPLAKVASVFVVGTSLRFEASILATAVRREQRRRGIRITSAVSFSSQRFQHEHIGTSTRSLAIGLENRLPSISSIVIDRTNIFLGVDILRSNFGFYVESLSHSFRRYLKTSNSKELRFGAVHSSIGSFNAAALAIKASEFSSSELNAVQTIVSVQQSGINQRIINKFSRRSAFIHFNTHRPEPLGPIASTDLIALPTTSLHERCGHVLTLNSTSGRRRTHNTVASSVGESRSVDSIWTVLARIQGSSTWRRWTQTLTRFENETAFSKLSHTANRFFSFSPFTSIQTQPILFQSQLFNPTVRSFALGDNISRHSPTIAEFSLFIETEGSFSRERLSNFLIRIYLDRFL